MTGTMIEVVGGKRGAQAARALSSPLNDAAAGCQRPVSFGVA
ncbi:hypothetical protein [Devosia sp.]